MHLFFIHKFIDGSMVKFTRTPQVLHTPTNSLAGVVTGTYIRMMKGRIAQVKQIYRKDVDVGNMYGEEKIENLWFFSIRFLDNNERMEIRPAITMIRVELKLIYLVLYKISRWFFKKQTQQS